jgi:hypothetical protein
VFAPRHRRKRKSLERQELVSLGKVNQSDAGLAGETETTPAVAVPKRNAVLQSIEADDGPIPGSFPEDIDTPASEAAEVRGSSQIEEVDVDSRKPFKCGSCGKRYKNSNGLKYVSPLSPLLISTTANNIAAQTTFILHRPSRRHHSSGFQMSFL